MHLRPSPEESMHVGSELPPLPLNKSCIEVFADFLTYLFQCASRFIKDAHANGENVWSSVQKDIHFVLSHPNGWEGFQQSQMRKAAILAGLISDSPNEHARINGGRNKSALCDSKWLVRPRYQGKDGDATSYGLTTDSFCRKEMASLS